ncbi:MAG: sulfite exporter TauE/SafE family protein [Rhodothalassiaceae bacterium]
MALYLPIAEMSLNIFLLIGIGAVVGFLSGMFGVGGGFLMTPFLIFVGVPPTVAVATGANLISASSVSGAIAHFRRNGVDVKMGNILIAGGAVGSIIGAWLFAYLKSIGQVDLLISLAYVAFLGTLGALMLRESLVALWRRHRGAPPPPRRRTPRGWLRALPFKTRFRASRLYLSVLLPLAVGALVGMLAAILGVGGGFIMIPAMIYILGMPTNVVVGTSLYQIIFVTAIITVLHAVGTQSVDIVLTLLLLAGAVLGAQAGARFGLALRAEQLRALLALIVLGVGVRMALDLVVAPDEPYSIAVLEK